MRGRSKPQTSPAGPASLHPVPRALLLLAFSLSGAAALIYEVTWFRPLTLVFGTSVYALSILISAFIGGLALGSWLLGAEANRTRNPVRLFAMLEIGVGVYGLIVVPLFGLLPSIYLGLYRGLGHLPEVFFAAQLLLAFAVLLPPTTLMGGTLPVLVKAYGNRPEEVGGDVGRLYAVNNLGAVIGTLAAGFILLPALGIPGSTLAAALLNLAAAGLVLVLSRQTRLLLVALIAIGLLSPAAFAYDIGLLSKGIYIHVDPRFPGLLLDRPSELLFYRESPGGTVIAQRIDGIPSLTLQGKVQCSTGPSDIATDTTLAELPLEAYRRSRGREPGQAFVIGLGCGITSGRFAQDVPTTTAELNPAVVEAAPFFASVNREVLRNSNHTLQVGDARNLLLRGEGGYDIISTQPVDLFVDKSSHLFTREAFQLYRDKTTPGGVVAQWVPLYILTPRDFQIFIATFREVFPYLHAYYTKPGGSTELILLGSTQPLQPLPGLVFTQDQIPPLDAPLNTDDHPLLEFAAARQIYHRDAKPVLEVITEWSHR